MTIIKKASVAANEQDAQEITQDNITPTEKMMSIPEEVLLELVAMKVRYDEIYQSIGLAGFMRGNGLYEGVQLSEKAFMATFKTYGIDLRDDSKYPEEPYVFLDGVRFFCIK